ncbi:MAG: hypothetical protein V7784_11290 [Oceanospirillaceae bacterium]
MKHFFILTLTLFLAGCDTVYQPLGWDGGYEDKALASDRYWIKYQGNATTSLTWVTQSWHKRAAQLCKNSYEVQLMGRQAAHEAPKELIDIPLNVDNPTVAGEIRCLLK